MRKLRSAVLICCLTMLTSIAAAEVKTEKFMRLYQSNSIALELYLTGLVEGYGWANTRLKQDNQKPLFCTPPDLPLTQGQAHAILKNKVSEEPLFNTFYLGITLLEALREVFPCR